MAANDQRSARLKRLFDTVLNGKAKLDNGPKCRQFLEAIPTLPDPPRTVERLITSDPNLRDLKDALRSDVSVAAINGLAVPVLQYIQDPSIKTLSRGTFLVRLVKAIADATTFWDELVRLFKSKQLEEAGQSAFGWVLHVLLTIPDDTTSPYLPLAIEVENLLTSSPFLTVRQFGALIKKDISMTSAAPSDPDEVTAGGRHDNDFSDFREVAVLPTADELDCSQPPFLRVARALDNPDTMSTNGSVYLDHLFRLLREDMIHEMRDGLQAARRPLKGKKSRGFVVDGLTLHSCETGVQGRRTKLSLVLQRVAQFPQLAQLTVPKRKKYLSDNIRFLKHDSLTCLLADNEVVAFPTLRRDEDRLSQDLPQLTLVLEGGAAMQKALLRLKTAQDVQLLQIDVPIFAYEPVLTALKRIRVLPLTEELLLWRPGNPVGLVELPRRLEDLVDRLKASPHSDISGELGSSKSIKLDPAQARALIDGLTQKVSIIQGPPGTGKSFIGAIIAKFLYLHSNLKILVVCFTNHALDQFLEDLLSIGIDGKDMVRIGSERKATPSTEPMLLSKQKVDFKFARTDWSLINELRAENETRATGLEAGFARYLQANVSDHDIMEFLEFEEQLFYYAFQLPKSSNGMSIAGKKGKALDEYSLLRRWRNGEGPGWFSQEPHIIEAKEIWGMPKQARQAMLARWIEAIRTEGVEELFETAVLYNKAIDEVERKFKEKDGHTLKNRRVIGCTTTAAAKYTHTIQDAAPDVILVEEAGEILECHVVTALGEAAKQLILIGDHKQLRPKVNNYKLTVEKGDGYDLNRSLFERLVLKGYPHDTLEAQHRMRPEISALVRELTYPDLKDAPKTQGRPDLRGVQGNVLFINHGYPEDELQNVSELRDMGAKSSKQNHYEARMVLKMVRYLAQQGYRTDNMVVLTPYLGQLRKLQQELREETDPVLNDLDFHDLIRAGLVTDGAAKASKSQLRVATIDNYQGEESDIVIASLTRSNSANDIGFMCAPERLNVLLSRARDGLILIGNSDTFTKSKKGGALWSRFFELIRPHITDGFPVQCQQHSSRQALLVVETDFEQKCPDGGCDQPCGTKLSCGLHVCPSKCHQLYDHSKMKCMELVPEQCAKGHDITTRCSEPRVSACQKCERDAKVEEKKKQKAHKQKEQRERDEAEHLRLMQDIEEKMEEERQKTRDARLRDERDNEARMKQADLEELRQRNKGPRKTVPIPSTQPVSAVESLPSPPSNNASHASDQAALLTAPAPPAPSQVVPPSAQPYLPQPSSPAQKPTKPAKTRNAVNTSQRRPAFPTSPLAASSSQSPSESIWQRKKDIDGTVNSHIDSIMDLTGLEDVKKEVLRIWDKIELSGRQGTSVNKERFNVVLLGNPGTGKTTVARHYAKFLSSVNVLPGDAFEETTGANVANDGVRGAKAILAKVLNAGGGAIFIDEAYQLVSGNSSGGASVLDFFLAEMENNVGKVVFILAGYTKEMEKFFEHNPGLTSRVPYRIHFNDYEDDELRLMFEKMMHKKWSGRMKIEDGPQGLFMRIAVRRLGRGRGRPGFGNARALENLLALITNRQAARIAEERSGGLRPDDLLLQREDLIGPDPASAMAESQNWKKLKKLTGLNMVKQAVQQLYDMILANYRRELRESEPVTVSLNRVFIGSPGTGKTTVAKLYGKILADLGLLSNGEVVVKNPADFIGSALGQSETNTKSILAATTGKVLVIDEAYMLYTGGSNGQQSDPYKTAVIDTLVAEVQSTLNEDRCVLLLGYAKQIREMFQNVNPGLSRRFAIEDAFKFEDYSSDELLQILDFKMDAGDMQATPEARAVALSVLERAKLRPNFGNGGDIENLLGKAKTNFANRNRDNGQAFEDIIFEPIDFDPDFDRSKHAGDRLVELFKDTVGCDETVNKLRRIQQTAKMAHARGEELGEMVPTTFVFKGPPGTGKTTTARKMGEVYFDMGMLARPAVEECSASDLIGQYVGHTGPLVRKMFEKALGQVLFIDEAYRLKDGHFAKEATDEIVTLLTDDQFKGKIIVILAGYDNDINQLLAANRGLSSRFTEEIVFANLTAADCLAILSKDLATRRIVLPGLDDAASATAESLSSIFLAWMELESWGNARDVKTLARQLISTAYQNASTDVGADSQLVLDPTVTIAEATRVLRERQERENIEWSPPLAELIPPIAPPPGPPMATPPQIKTITTTSTAEAPPPPPKKIETRKATAVEDKRDAGVSDAIWAELQASKDADAAAQALAQKEMEDAARELKERRRQEALEQRRATDLRKQQAEERDRERINELKRLREEQRLRELEARRRRQEAEALIKAQREAQEQNRKREAAAQRRLREIGNCVAGFKWQKIAGGYRCAGGSHYVTDTEIGPL